MKSLETLLLAGACLLAAQLVATELPPFKEASLPCHRLPTNVEPTKYELHLKFPSLDSDVYEGQVDIAVDFKKSSAKMLAAWDLRDVSCAKQYDENTFMMHADKSLEIQHIRVTTHLNSVFKSKTKDYEIVELVRDEAKQMIGIKMKDGIRASKQGIPGKVSITFKGRMRTDKRGVYLSTYNDGQQVFKQIVSQFQPTDARTVFPCFDEPRFRVPFSLSVTHPIGLTAYGNTEVHQVSDEGGLKRTLFATTPDMPVHMVAFAIGQFDKPLELVFKTSKSNFKKLKKIRVITAPGKRQAGLFAFEVARKSFEWFEKYIGYEFALDKLDVIAIADLDKDNSEGWGLVFVRDTLLWIDNETKPETRITTAVNIAHVVVHQWFGNLISANWWSNLWITEGVAAQLSLNMVKDMYNFYSEYFVRMGTLSSVLQADQAGNLHPLSPSEDNLQTSDQIKSIFDKLQFMKSASMAQMIEETLGSIEYQKILRKLVEEFAYKTINFQDYQDAILKANLKDRAIDVIGVLKLLRTFPKYTGVPVVNCKTATAAGRAIMMDLDSFANEGQNMEKAHDCEQTVAIKVGTIAGDMGGSWGWPVRIQIVDSNNERCRNIRELPDWFNLNDPTREDFFKIDREPSIASYYRARYSDELYDRLQVVIKKQLIPAMDRIQILDDANSFVQAGLITTERYKSLLNSYANEDVPAVLLAIVAATNTYRGLSPEGVSSLESNKALSALFQYYRFGVPNGYYLILQRAREVVLTTLVKQGNQEVIAAALEAFDKAQGEVDLCLREPIYTAIVLSGSSERVNKLLGHLLETKSYEEKIRLLTALTLSKDKELLTKAKSWLESSGFKEEISKPFLDTISEALSK